jgi:thiol-disulfide isomerase/thioredoxin
MKRILLSLFILITISIQAQDSISGTFSPAEDYSWLIAYRLKPGTQVYVADTAIKDGKFSLKLPENSIPGTYRLVYAVPQEEYNFDIIYNGKESIELNFLTSEGVVFTRSEENILFSTYFKEINALKGKLISFYSNGSTDVNDFRDIITKYREQQEYYQKKSEDLIVHEIIKANKTYIPSDYESVQSYIQNQKKKYFENLDFKNSLLQSSGFLTDKLTNYALTALPLEQLEKAETEKEIQDNITTISKNLEGVNDMYSFHLMYSLWTQCSASGYQDTADFIFETYLKTSPLAETNKDIIKEIEVSTRLRIGAFAPELKWKEGDKNTSLSGLEEAKNYVLVFWSSTCGHCLKELPQLHKELKENNTIKVVAVGLENDEDSWNTESAKLDHFHHAIALGKWDSEYADLYDIHATPSYFILDADKKIIAKPETDKEVVEFLKSN